MLSFYRYDMSKFGMVGAPLHDPCVIAYLLAPEIFDGKHVALEVEISSEKTMGMTLADWWAVAGKPPNCTVMNAIDDEAFFGLLIERIAGL